MISVTHLMQTLDDPDYTRFSGIHAAYYWRKTNLSFSGALYVNGRSVFDETSNSHEAQSKLRHVAQSLLAMGGSIACDYKTCKILIEAPARNTLVLKANHLEEDLPYDALAALLSWLYDDNPEGKPYRG